MIKMKEAPKRAEDRFRKLQTEILFLYVAVILGVSFFLAIVILGRSSMTIREKVSSLIAANSRQLELNINSYLDNVETTATLLFSDESYYLYDATDEMLDEYGKIKSEENIVDRIVDLGLMENFADFGIVYANDHTVGWISNTTAAMFADGGMYEEFAGYITNQKTNDGWIFGVHGNFDRMYYVKRLNPNAVLIASFYNKELDSVFEYPEELDGMTVRLVNGENIILFSSQREEIGSALSADIVELIGNGDNVSVMGREYLVNTNVCENGWRVVCAIPTDVILEENNELRNFTVLFSVGIVAAFITLGLLMIRRLTRPVDGMFSNLEEKAALDQLSGLLNKAAFQEQVTGLMQKEEGSWVFGFVMLDMDNFKQINDTRGHAYGDQVIARTAHLLWQLFGGKYTIGRVGGDEFAMYAEFVETKKELAQRRIQLDMMLLQDAFAEEFQEECQKYNTSLSIGAAVFKGQEGSFEKLYRKADKALYESKRNGKNQFTWYQEEMGDV